MNVKRILIMLAIALMVIPVAGTIKADGPDENLPWVVQPDGPSYEWESDSLGVNLYSMTKITASCLQVDFKWTAGLPIIEVFVQTGDDRWSYPITTIGEPDSTMEVQGHGHFIAEVRLIDLMHKSKDLGDLDPENKFNPKRTRGGWITHAGVALWDGYRETELIVTDVEQVYCTQTTIAKVDPKPKKSS